MERKDEILQLLHMNGSVKTSELSELLSTTRQTIHNDLKRLEEEGKLTKVHGGAVRNQTALEPVLEVRKVRHKEPKIAIAKCASSFVEEGDSLFLDVSTTVGMMVPYLLTFKNLTIITNSLEIAYQLSTNNSLTIIITGGKIRQQDYASSSAHAKESLKSIYVDKAFFGVGGVSTDAGYTDFQLDDSEIRQVILANSTKSFILFDNSKIGQITLSKFASLKDIDVAISYDMHDEKLVRTYDTLGVNFIDAEAVKE